MASTVRDALANSPLCAQHHGSEGERRCPIRAAYSTDRETRR